MGINAILGLVSVAAVLAVIGWVYLHGKHVEALEGQVTTKTIILDKADKNANIAVNRPDFDTLVNGVWGTGSY